jgi:(1->4)-alpha-D-glucan 1-alpha-D-glucosylmutase
VRVRRFAFKLQQFTGPVMAKSLEDTAFYRYHRLLALNEVGGNPASDGLSTPAFHAMMQQRAKRSPHCLTATATHDTKRGEDARARVMALAEIAGEWAAIVARWKVLNAPCLVAAGNMRAPSVTAEYMLYQALLGAWPVGERDSNFLDRFQAYALKAAREGKEETSWLNPNTAYEEGLRIFIARILDPAVSGEFLSALETLAQRLTLLGALNSLSQLTLKATLPGAPDFYQGTELWDLSLVDPDNRRPVNFAARAKKLAALETPDWATLVQKWQNGGLKFAWTRHLLKLRAEHAELFTFGDYQPLEVSGPHREHIIAFARRRGREVAITVAAKAFAPFTQAGRVLPRIESFEAVVSLQGFALDGVSPGSGELPVSLLFKHLPVAVLKARTVMSANRMRQRVSD